MIMGGCLGLLAGVFPTAGLLLAIAGVVLKIAAAAATRRA